MPALELIVSVDDRPYEEFDGGFRNEEGVRGEDPRDGAVGHSSKKPCARGMMPSGAKISKGFCRYYDDKDKQESSDHPNDKLLFAKQRKQLIERMGRFGNGTKRSDEDCARADKNRAYQRIPREGLMQYESREQGIEYQPGSL